MPTQEEQAKGNDRWTRRWFNVRRLVAGQMEIGLELSSLYMTHMTFIFKGHEVMCVMKATNAENEKLVAFHSAVDWEACLYGALAKLDGDNVKWRPDTPWKGK